MSLYSHFFFNGRWSYEFDWLIVNDIASSVLPDIENKSVSVPGRAGLYLFGKNRAARIESIRISIIASDRADREAKRKILAGWLDTDAAQTLKYSYRSDEYMAILDGSTDLERITSHGATTLNFLVPDPDSLGESHSQVISGARVSRTEDTQEKWQSPGSVLQDVEATAGGDLQLIKAGTDYSGSVDTGWESGTHNNTVERNNNLELAYERLGGSSFSATENTTAQFNTGTLTGVTATSNNLVLSNMPNYNGFRAGFSNIASTAWVTYGGVYQETGYVRIQVDAGQTFGGIRLFDGGVLPMTLDFYASTWGAGARHFIHCSDGSKYLDQQITSLTGQGNWGWYRARWTTTTLHLYLNGSLIGSYPLNSSNPTSNRVSFGIDTSAPGGFLIDSCYMAKSDLGAPTATSYNITGNRVSTYNVSSVTNVASSSISWDWTNETYTNDSSLQNVAVQVSWDGSNWTNATNGASIPIISPSDNLSGKTLYVRQILTANDPVFSPKLNSLSISIDAGDNEYYSSGYRDSVSITAARPATRVGSTLFSWTDNKPAGTDVKAYTQVSLNAGSTWTDWAEVTNGGSIPDLPPGTNISQLSFRYRFALSTNNPLVTPSVDRAEYKIFSGYKAEGYRISPPVSLDSLGIAGDSFIAWDVTPDASPDVLIDTQLVNIGDPPDSGSWLSATIEGAIPGIVKGITDLAGKELYVRQRLLSPDGTTTPLLHLLMWYVDGNASNFISHDDTEIGEMTIDSLPIYSFRDAMDNYAGSGWTASGAVAQEVGFTRINKPSAGSGTAIMLSRHDQSLSPPYTIDFRVRTITDWETFIFCADMLNRFDVALPNTADEWKWMRLVVTETEAHLYEFGNPVAYGSYTPSGGGYYSLGFAIYDSGVGTIDIDAIYVSSGNLGVPSTTSWTETQTKQLDIGSIEVVNAATIDWDWSATTATVDPTAQNATLETRVSLDGVTWSDWESIPDGSSSIPDLPPDTELGENAKLEYRATLTTSDPGYSPTINHLNIYIESAIDNRVVDYVATAPSRPIIRVSFQEAANELEILHQETGNRILLNYPFQVGDNVIVDCNTGKVTVNGQLKPNTLSIYSDLADFELKPGKNTFVSTPMSAAYTEIEWQERWK